MIAWLPNGASADAVVKANADTQPKKRLSSIRGLCGDWIMAALGLTSVRSVEVGMWGISE